MISESTQEMNHIRSSEFAARKILKGKIIAELTDVLGSKMIITFKKFMTSEGIKMLIEIVKNHHLCSPPKGNLHTNLDFTKEEAV